MKKIAEIENAKKNDALNELNISYKFYWAYEETKERKNKHVKRSIKELAVEDEVKEDAFDDSVFY